MAVWTSSDVEAFLGQVGEALEALGPDESREVVAELRTLLHDATTEAGGDASAALAGYGDPQTLAARILEERGVHSGPTRIASAPVGTRLGALAVDVVLWIAALVFVYAVGGVTRGNAAYLGASSLVSRAGVGLLAVAAAAGSIWWWASWRRGAGTPTSGLALFGLRRIRVAGETRVVRTADIPGAVRSRRGWPVVKLVASLGLVALLLSSLAQGSRAAVQGDQDAVLADITTSVSLVTEAYRTVVTDGGEDRAAGLFGPSAASGLTDLLGRRDAGLVDAYTVRELGPDTQGRTFSDLTGAEGGRLSIPVTVCEHAGDRETGCYRYHVASVVTVDGRGGATGDWWIESVRRVD